MGYVDTAYWLDVGTPEAFVRGSCDLVRGRLASPALPGPSRRGAGAARRRGRSRARSVTGGTVVGAGSHVGAGAQVDGTRAVRRRGRSARAPWSRPAWSAAARQIGDGAVLDGAVIGDGARIGPGNELCSGLRVWPGAELGPDLDPVLHGRLTRDAARPGSRLAGRTAATRDWRAPFPSTSGLSCPCTAAGPRDPAFRVEPRRRRLAHLADPGRRRARCG